MHIKQHNLNFIIDEQLPIALAKNIRNIGFEAIHVYEIGLGGASDKMIAKEVMLRNGVLISKDEDFVEKSNLGKVSFQVIWIRIGNISNKNLWEKIEQIFPLIVSRIKKGDMIVEIRSHGNDEMALYKYK